MRRMTIGAVLIVAAGCATGGPATQAPPPSATTAPTGNGTPAGTPTGDGTPAASPKPTPATTRVGCHGTPVIIQGDGFPEVRGASQDAEVWGLLFAPVPFKRGKEVKIVWRMTGEGPLKVTAALPDGTRAKPTFGPEQHGSSSWRRPGEEWGTGFVFPKAGCYRVDLTRTHGSGHLWLPVK
ncbi:hypothetical protein [Nonomuraea aurantiaca]|uniref:hypothetical protein n=1 Tax=Nonomuraea aurantiaca TaxID=2878562 RepID=UPI001CD920E6|nr:hypothetical protein [Nonomuraea aurantiaca]MCA2221099.1 hypothetical protein [Nonomuraea aurantiaca]